MEMNPCLTQTMLSSCTQEGQTGTAVTIPVSPPICGESFVPSLGLRPHPFLLESSCKEYLRDKLAIKSPQRHFLAFS